MIKQSKTTIKELTAQYRAVLKHAFFAGIAAVAVSTTGAMAVPMFGEDLAVKGSDVTTAAANEYFYTAGGIDTIVSTIQTEKPDGTKYGFKDPDGTGVTLDVNGDTTLTADSYAKDSAAKTSDVVTWSGGDTVKYDSEIKKDDYSFKTQKFTVDGSGNVKFGEDGKAMTEAGTDGVLSAGTPADVVAKYTFSDLNTGFTGQQTITSSTAIDATKYQQKVGTSVVLHLNDDGTKILDAEGHDVSLVPDYQTAFTELKTAYDTDKKHLSAIQTALTTVDQYNSDNYGTADGVYNADSTLKNNLSTWQGEFAQAKSDFSDAAGAYDVSLGKAIDSRILNEDGAVAKAVKNLIDTKEDLLSADIGYDLGNPDDAEKGLVARLDALTAESADKTLVGAINTNTNAIAKRTVSLDETEEGLEFATITDGTNSANVYTKEAAEAIFAEKQQWVDKTLGITSENTDAVKSEYASTNYLKNSASLTSADKALDTQIKTNADEIAKRTVSLDETEEGLEFATITDGTNSANVYTKEAAEAIFAEKQQWVDKTLGINSADTDAVKNEYAGTNYLGLSTTLTDADIALDSAIKNNANAIDDLSKSMRSADAQLRNDINALDSKVNELDENLSAGIASSVALSSVAVANVQKGEMSVGGGYGNYNSKSAVALGAALGITDNWSANAGVGLGFGSGSKASFRVGTNYKFKLF